MSLILLSASQCQACKVTLRWLSHLCVMSSTDHPLEESEDIRILKEGGRHSLIISHVSNEDEGLYTVVACNSHGEAECAAELYVQEPRPAISSQMYDVVTNDSLRTCFKCLVHP